MLKGQEGNTEAIARTQFSVEDANAMLKEAGKPELAYYDEKATTQYLVDANGTWSQEAAFNHLETVLAQYNEANNNMPELIIANNDGMALGAIQSLQGHGYNDGNGTTIRSLIEQDIGANHYFAGDLIKSGDKAPAGTSYTVDPSILYKVIHKRSIPFMSAFEVGTSFFNPKSLTDSNLIAGEAPVTNIPAEYEAVGTWRVNIPYSAYTK